MSSIKELKEYQPTGHVQWDIYQIVYDYFCPYAGIKPQKDKLTQQELIKNMQFDLYVKISGETKKGKIVIAILGRNEKNVNEIATTTEKFRLFINSIKESDAEIMIISPCKFQTHVINFIYDNQLHKRITMHSYDNFKIVVPLGPYCSEHRILDPDEAKQTLEELKLNPKEMKKIYTTDPQIVWLRAHPGDIIAIDRINPLSGKSADIRRVVKGDMF